MRNAVSLGHRFEAPNGNGANINNRNQIIKQQEIPEIQIAGKIYN